MAPSSRRVEAVRIGFYLMSIPSSAPTWRRRTSGGQYVPGCRSRKPAWSRPSPRRNAMKRTVSTLLVVLTATAAVRAQESDPRETQLSETQRLGRQVFAQSCGICHLQPSLGVKTYGPMLNNAAAGGSDDAMRAFILNEIGRASCRERGEMRGGGV